MRAIYAIRALAAADDNPGEVREKPGVLGQSIYLRNEIRTPHDGLEYFIYRDKQKTVVIMRIRGQHESFVCGIAGLTVIGAAGKVVELAGNRVSGMKTVQIISGVIIAAAFTQTGIIVCAVLSVERRAG